MLPSFGMADDHVANLQGDEHPGRHLARVRAFLLPVDVLGADRVRELVALHQRLHAAQRRERRADHDLDPLGVLLVQEIGELLDVLDRLQMRLVHLPVRRHDRPSQVSHGCPP
jgi:hypothetical protein